MTQDNTQKMNPYWKRQQGFAGRQRRISRRRLWLLALIVLYQLFIYPIGTALVIGAQNQTLQDYSGSPALLRQLRLYRQGAVSSYLGLRQTFWWVPLVMGAIAGIAEFAGLFSMVKMDFYESQPVSRKQRFRDLWYNGALLFTIPQWVMGLLAILTAAAMDAMNTDILADALLALLVNTISFLASFSMTSLACMLCGNGIVAACLTGFFLLAEPLWRVLWQMMAGSYFVTYHSQSFLPFGFTPVMNAYHAVSTAQRYAGFGSGNILRAWQLRLVGGEILPSLAANLVICGAAALLARLAMLRRRTESAGSSILYLPVREVVRILIAATAAVMAGYMVNMVTRASSYQNSSAGGIILTLLILTIVGMIAAGVIQCIYEFNLRSFFHEFWSMLFAVLLGVVVMAFFAFDLTGFDRYLPKEDQVAWGSLSFFQNYGPYYTKTEASDSGVSQDDYLAENMRLTGEQVEDLLTVAQEGQAYLVESAKDTSGSSYPGYSAAVTWQLKDGRTVSRNLLIPYDVDAAAMNSIVSSQNYKEAVYPVYQNDAVQDRYASKSRLIYTDGFLQKSGSGDLYEKFKEAYRKDLAQYSFSMASGELPLGYVGLLYTPEDSDMNSPYIQSYYEVYPEYTNTLTFLKENHLYLKPLSETPDRAAQITVTAYETMSGDATEKTYTDPEAIRTILSAAVNGDMVPEWYPEDRTVDYNYFITIEVNPDQTQGEELSENFGGNLYFRKGKVPAVVTADPGGNHS